MEEISPPAHTCGMKLPLFSTFLGFPGCVSSLCREEAVGQIFGVMLGSGMRDVLPGRGDATPEPLWLERHSIKRHRHASRCHLRVPPPSSLGKLRHREMLCWCVAPERRCGDSCCEAWPSAMCLLCDLGRRGDVWIQWWLPPS